VADQAPDTISPEAFERVKQENAALKAQVAELKPVLEDITLRDRMYDHFNQKGEPNAYGLAQAAIRDATLKGAEPDALPGRLDSWLTEQRTLLGVQTTAPPSVEAEEGSAAPPPSPFGRAGANPEAAGEPAGLPKSTMSAEYQSWARGKSMNERAAAVKRGEFSVPGEISKLVGGKPPGA
jgi:hypothetical protein